MVLPRATSICSKEVPGGRVERKVQGVYPLFATGQKGPAAGGRIDSEETVEDKSLLPE